MEEEGRKGRLDDPPLFLSRPTEEETAKEELSHVQGQEREKRKVKSIFACSRRRYMRWEVTLIQSGTDRFLFFSRSLDRQPKVRQTRIVVLP